MQSMYQASSDARRVERKRLLKQQCVTLQPYSSSCRRFYMVWHDGLALHSNIVEHECVNAIAVACLHEAVSGSMW